jgi:hypothetical protein
MAVLASGPPASGATGWQVFPSALHIPDAQSTSVLALQLPLALQVGVTRLSSGQVVVPQTVPAGWFPLSTHSDSPLVQEVRPALHLFVRVHVWLAVQLPQVPEWQTRCVPHELPSAAGRQAPEPLQVVNWQDATVAPQAESTVPAGSFVQVPGVVRLQEVQAPHLLLEQQTPSTQLPLVHSPPAPQPVPSGFFTTQAFETQYGLALLH